MAALHGLTKVFSTSTEKVLGSYLAGLWEHDLVTGLLFDAHKREMPSSNSSASEDKDSSVQAHFRPPSWSWTSAILDGYYIIRWESIGNIQHFRSDPDFSVENISCTPVSQNNPFGWAKDGILKVRGRVTKIVAQPQKWSWDYKLIQTPTTEISPWIEFTHRGKTLNISDFLILQLGYEGTSGPEAPHARFIPMLQESKGQPGCWERVTCLRVGKGRFDIFLMSYVNSLVIIRRSIKEG